MILAHAVATQPWPLRVAERKAAAEALPKFAFELVIYRAELAQFFIRHLVEMLSQFVNVEAE
jgi:hypothetical protein